MRIGCGCCWCCWVPVALVLLWPGCQRGQPATAECVRRSVRWRDRAGGDPPLTVLAPHRAPLSSFVLVLVLPVFLCAEPVSHSSGKLAALEDWQLVVVPVGGDPPPKDHREPQPGARALEASRLQGKSWPQCRPEEQGTNSKGIRPQSGPWLCYQSRNDPDSIRW